MRPKFKLIGECGGKDQVRRAVLALSINFIHKQQNKTRAKARKKLRTSNEYLYTTISLYKEAPSTI
jgi:hypothetical protein